MDDESAEQQYREVMSSSLPPDKVFEQQWAVTLLDQVVARLREEFVAAGKGAFFEELQALLVALNSADRLGNRRQPNTLG